MNKFVLIFSLILFVLGASVASGNNQASPSYQTDADIVRGADAVVKQFYPTSGQPRSWQYTYSLSTNDGSLGCPLVASYNLGYYLQPYRVEITYQNLGTFIVHLGYSTGGTLSISLPCDSRLGVVGGIGGPTSPPQIEIVPACSASSLPGRDGAIYPQPVQSGNNPLAYLRNLSNVQVIGRTANTSHYQVQVGNQNGWVSLAEVNLSGAGCNNIPVTSNVVEGTTQTGAQCMLTAIRARVRTAPSLNGAILREITTGQSVLAIGRTSNANDLWYQVSIVPEGSGWVSASVSSIAGTNCSGLPVTDTNVTTDAQGQQFNISVAPSATGCPVGYADFLPPRLVAGGQASVTFDGLRVRSSPDINQSSLIFEMPAGTNVIVLAGPVCEGRRIWWQIVLNNVIGWMAESDAEVGYYTEPRVQPPGVRFAPPLLDVSAEIGRVQTGDRVAHISFTPDNTAVAVANGSDSFIRTWDTATGEDVNEVFVQRPDVQLTFVDYQPDSRLTVTAGTDYAITLWSENAILARFESGMVAPYIADVAVSPLWDVVAVGGCLQAGDAGCLSYGVNFFSLQTGDLLETFASESSVRNIAFDADGRLLAVAGIEGEVVVYDTVLMTSLLQLELIAVVDIVFAPDGRIALIAQTTPDSDAVVTLLDAQTGAPQAEIGVAGTITSFAFSPNGAFLALGTADDSTILWDVVDNKEIETFTGFVNGVSSFAFARDNRTLAVGDGAGNLVLLDVR